MIGPDLAASNVASYLTDALPLHLAELRLQYPGDKIPDPRTITASEPGEIGAEHWPALLVMPDSVESIDRNGFDELARPVHEVTYRMVIEGYVRAQGYAATARLNRQYAAAVRSALWFKPSAGSSAAHPRIDVESIAEEYAPVFEASRGRTIGSFRTTFLLRQRETPLLPSQAGKVVDVDVSVTAVGPAEPMPGG